MTKPEIETRLDLMSGKKPNTTRYVSRRKNKNQGKGKR